jgi:hypothetical protein
MLYAQANNMTQSFHQVMYCYRMLHRMSKFFNPRHFLIPREREATVAQGKKRGRKIKLESSSGQSHWTGTPVGMLDIWRDLDHVAGQMEKDGMDRLQGFQFFRIVVELLEYDLAFGNNTMQSLIVKSLEAGDRAVLERVLAIVRRLFLVGYSSSEQVMDLTQRLFHLIGICFQAKAIDVEKFKEQLNNVLSSWNQDASRAAFLHVRATSKVS